MVRTHPARGTGRRWASELLKSHRRSLRHHAAVRVTVIDPVFFKPYMVLVLENLPATAAHREELAARTSNAGTF